MNNSDHPTYDKLRELIFKAMYPKTPPILANIGRSKEVLDAIWPVVVELLAVEMEYEHALAHVADPPPLHTNGVNCPDCQRLAQSALDGVNRQMCRELITDA